MAGGGASLISFDGLLIRLQNLTPTSVLFWRGLLTGIAFAGIAIVMNRSGGRDKLVSRQTSWPGTLLAVVTSLATITWVFALTHTTIAHALVIASCSPIATAVLGRLLLGEHLPVRTWLAGLAAAFGVAVVVSGSISTGDFQGDVWAVLATGLLALMLIVLRHYQDIDRITAMSIGGFLLSVVVIPWGVQTPDLRTSVAAGLDGLLVLPVSLVLITAAPRYLPAAEVGLILLLEVILAPLWVLVVLGELLTPQVVLSAAVILGAIVIHSVIDLRSGDALRRGT